MKKSRAYLGILLLLGIGFTLCSSRGLAQDVRGTVRDQRNGSPIPEVLVRVTPVGALMLTDQDGYFRILRVPKGLSTISFKALGYQTVVRSIQVPLDSPLEVELPPAPLGIPGFEVEAESFENRMDQVGEDMDLRLARLGGLTRVAGPDRIRLYDSIPAGDNWTFLNRELTVGWDFTEGMVQILGRKKKPEVYLDDRRVWLFVLTERLHPSQLCRVEVFEPLRRGLWQLSVPFQIRAYTCYFMAQVANGERTMRKYINYGDLISGG